MKKLFRVAGQIVGLTALIVLGACSQKNEEAAPAAAPPAIAPINASAEVKPFTIGEFQAAAIADGGMTVPNDNKILAVNAKKADVDALLTANGLPTDQLSLSIQPLNAAANPCLAHTSVFIDGMRNVLTPATALV